MMSKRIQEMTEDIQNRVREVAYMMWESAGRHQGMALEYWLAAEREVLATMRAAAERLMPSEVTARPDPGATAITVSPGAKEAPADTAQSRPPVNESIPAAPHEDAAPAEDVAPEPRASEPETAAPPPVAPRKAPSRAKAKPKA